MVSSSIENEKKKEKKKGKRRIRSSSIRSPLKSGGRDIPRFNLFSERSVRTDRDKFRGKDRASCREADEERAGTVARFIWENGQAPTSRRQRGKGRSKRDFMSRNSPGSPTFMFYPVIMMSTYTLDKTKHYSNFFSSTYHHPPPLSLPYSVVVGQVVVDVFVPV